MQHLIIAIVFLTNFLFWRFPLFAVSKRILALRAYFAYPLMYACFFLLPYCISLITLQLLDIDTNLLSNAILVISLTLFSMSFFKHSVHAKNSFPEEHS